MKFNLNDFLELDTNGLFAMNGGTDCHSLSYSPSSTTSEGGSGGLGFGICQQSCRIKIKFIKQFFAHLDSELPLFLIHTVLYFLNPIVLDDLTLLFLIRIIITDSWP